MDPTHIWAHTQAQAQVQVPVRSAVLAPPPLSQPLCRCVNNLLQLSYVVVVYWWYHKPQGNVKQLDTLSKGTNYDQSHSRITDIIGVASSGIGIADNIWLSVYHNRTGWYLWGKPLWISICSSCTLTLCTTNRRFIRRPMSVGVHWHWRHAGAPWC